MYKLHYAIIAVCSALYLIGCNNQTSKSTTPELTQAQKDSIEQVRRDSIRVADSIQTAEKHRADSIAEVKRLEKEAAIAKLAKNFNVKTDEFSDKIWVHHKSEPSYRNRNAVFLYFQTNKENKPSNLRFVVQYEDDDWLFIKNMIFNIDGENFTFIPADMDRDCGNGGRIWEWCDESASLGDNMTLIKKIADAKTVKIKLNGRQYYNTRTMSAAHLKAFKETLDYYFALSD